MKSTITKKILFAVLCSGGLLCSVGQVSAGGVPMAHEASPDIYKVLAENDEFRVLMATWKPGQKDKPHGHPSMAVYSLTDCEATMTNFKGKTKKIKPKAGNARVKKPVKSHVFQNTSNKTCQTLLIEKK